MAWEKKKKGMSIACLPLVLHFSRALKRRRDPALLGRISHLRWSGACSLLGSPAWTHLQGLPAALARQEQTCRMCVCLCAPARAPGSRARLTPRLPSLLPAGLAVVGLGLGALGSRALSSPGVPGALLCLLARRLCDSLLVDTT